MRVTIKKKESHIMSTNGRNDNNDLIEEDSVNRSNNSFNGQSPSCTEKIHHSMSKTNQPIPVIADVHVRQLRQNNTTNDHTSPTPINNDTRDDIREYTESTID